MQRDIRNMYLLMLKTKDGKMANIKDVMAVFSDYEDMRGNICRSVDELKDKCEKANMTRAVGSVIYAMNNFYPVRVKMPLYLKWIRQYIN